MTNSTIYLVCYFIVLLQSSALPDKNSPETERVAVIAGLITLIGVVIQSLFTYYFVTAKDLANKTALEKLRSELAVANDEHLTRLQHELELANEKQMAEVHSKLNNRSLEQQAILQSHLRTKSERRAELEVLFKAVCDAKYAAEILRDTAEALPHIRLIVTAGSLQMMASFFKTAKDAERSLLLLDEEKRQINEIHAELATLYLALDLDQNDRPYRDRLTASYSEFEKRFSAFEKYVRKQILD